MRKDVTNWTKDYSLCQADKVIRPNNVPRVILAPATEKLNDKNLDVVGPLPEVKEM